MATVDIRSQTAVELYAQRLHALEHPQAGLLRLVQFSHDSPGLQKLRRHIAESLVLLLETNGLYIVNGLSEARTLLEANGYEVTEVG